MRRLLVLAAVVASGFATPVSAQQDQATCLAQMQAQVRPLLERAGMFSPQGVAGQGFVPLTQPFAPPAYALPYGYPAPPTLAPPTAQYNASAGYTGLVGLQQPLFSSQSILGSLIQGGRLNPANPATADPNLLLALANLQQTEQARQQQQALLQQQQGLYLNSLYQLSSSYQVTSLDWAEAYSGLAQAWMAYYRDLCAQGSGLGGVGTAAPATDAGAGALGVVPGIPLQTQPFPTYPAGNYPMTPPFPGVPGVPGGFWR